MKPVPYSLDHYVRWHDALIPDDQPLLDKLGLYRFVLVSETRSDLDLLYRVLAYMFTYCENEYRRSRRQEAKYQTPLSEALSSSPTKTPSSRYDNLFKSVPSIVNKMWRKAGEAPVVTMANLFETITDLIRTDVRTETLDSAQFLAHRMNDLPGLLYDADLAREFKERVRSISFEPEMKMASGYFAYHGLVRFASGYTVEVQIYSALMSEWRRLSHQLYERVRLDPIAKHEFASPEARLISLGHSLHLAECEIMRLRQEIDLK